MFEGWKQRLTYRHVLQLLSALVGLVLAYMWLTNTPIPIEGIEEQHEPLIAFIGAAGAFIVLGVSILFPHLTGDRLVFAPPSERAITDNQRQKNRQAMLDLVEKV